jgi:hypothetical protein
MLTFRNPRWLRRTSKPLVQPTELRRHQGLSELGRLGGVILLTLFGGSADFSHRPSIPTQAKISHDLPPGVPVIDVTPPELKPAPAPGAKVPSPLEKTKTEAEPKLRMNCSPRTQV